MGQKSSGSSTMIPTLSPEQNADIAAKTGLFTSTIAPAYQTVVTGATDLYNLGAPGVTNAAQNLAGTANQAQTVLGSTGESALTSGINALQNLNSPQYQQAQINAALLPAQQQYAQNIAAQQAQFGGAGMLGSSRQALAERQTAGSAQAQQQAAVAQVLKDISQQQYMAGSQLGQLGQAGLGGAQAAAQNQVAAARIPSQFFNADLAATLFGTPASSYTPDFRGTQGRTTTEEGFRIGITPKF
jgi:hypothetical protein